jgi:hypothetical protein
MCLRETDFFVQEQPERGTARREQAIRVAVRFKLFPFTNVPEALSTAKELWSNVQTAPRLLVAFPSTTRARVRILAHPMITFADVWRIFSDSCIRPVARRRP